MTTEIALYQANLAAISQGILIYITSGDSDMHMPASGIQFNTSSSYSSNGGMLLITATLTNVRFTVNWGDIRNAYRKGPI